MSEMVNESNVMEQQKIAWDEFESKGSDNYLKRKVGQKYLLSFKPNSMIQVATLFKDKDGKEKPGTALRLTLDMLDGQPSVKTLDITSKKEALSIKAFFEAGILYAQKFNVTRSGEGTQTNYQWINLGPK